MRPAHAALAALACVVVPAASWLDGTGSLAWTMFSGNSSYRLEIAAISAGGERRPIAPNALARYVGVEERPAFVAADRWRTMPFRGLRLRLPEVAALACRVQPADEVEVTLVTRRDLDAPPERRVERARCGSTP